MSNYEILHGDCLDVLQLCIDDNSIDAIVCDPPYGLGFMGKHWDHGVPSAEMWAECLRVLKPGGHLLAFAGTRTQHRMACNIEDAGFDIRDMIAWVYGSGFPKSRNLDGQWQGWGTALKPALEPITVARKPLIGTVAENVLTHGTGAINVDGCRVGNEGGTTRGGQAPYAASGWRTGHEIVKTDAGRWPANMIHDGCDEVLGMFPKSVSGTSESQSRFFYCAKASKKDRNEGCENMPLRVAGGMSGRQDGSMGSVTYNNNTHPTVKPTDLMRYLVRLVTPPGGVVLDPFMGSGSTGKAAMLEGFRFIGIEKEAEYVEIARARIARAAA